LRVKGIKKEKKGSRRGGRLLQKGVQEGERMSFPQWQAGPAAGDHRKRRRLLTRSVAAA